MILVDFNQCVIANLFAQLGAHTNIEIEEDLLKNLPVSNQAKAEQITNEMIFYLVSEM